jgi:hypothetical protein
MSNPAQPSFVWQLYHYDLEPNASLFAVKKAGEPVHIQFNEATDELQVINNLPEPLSGAMAHVAIYRLDGALASEYDVQVSAPASSATDLGLVKFPDGIVTTHFLKLDLRDANGKPISTNFYWRAEPGYPNVLTDMGTMPPVTLDAQAEGKDTEGRRTVTVTLHNPTGHIALMTHLQLRLAHSGERVLPVFASDNYISLAPNETRTVTLQADAAAFKGEDALVTIDGWNVSVAAASSSGVAIAPNVDAQPDHWPATGMPYQTVGLR